MSSPSVLQTMSLSTTSSRSHKNRTIATLLRATPALLASAVLVACSTGSNPHNGVNQTGSIFGTLEAVGGPSAGPPRPLPGEVTATGGGHTYTVTVGQDGQYSMTVRGGNYTVSGHSPMYQDGGWACEAPGTVRVQPPTGSTADCRPPAAWDRFEVSSARRMGPPLRQ